MESQRNEEDRCICDSERCKQLHLSRELDKILSLMNPSVDKILALLANKQMEVPTFLDTLAEYEPQRYCSESWPPGSMAFRCKTCSNNLNMAICTDCFREGEHENHDYMMFKSGGGGACDCGYSLMKESGHCKRHGNNVQSKRPNQPIPKVLLCVPRRAMPRLVHRLAIGMRQSQLSDHTEHILFELYLSHLRTLVNSSAILRNLMIEVLLSEKVYKRQLHLLINHSDEVYAQTIVKGIRSIKTAVKKLLVCFKIPSEWQDFNPPKIKAFCDSLKPTCFLEELILWAVVYAIPPKLMTILLSFLMDKDYKLKFAKTFVRYYPRILVLMAGNSKLALEQRNFHSYEILGHRLNHISSQLYNDAALTNQLCEEEHILHTLIYCIRVAIEGSKNGHLKGALKPNPLSLNREAAPKVVNYESVIFRETRLITFYTDLNAILEFERQAERLVDDKRLLCVWLNLVSYFQTMSPYKRALHEHTPYDNASQNSLFMIEQGFCLTPMWSVLSSLDSRNIKNITRATAVMQSIQAKMCNWFHKMNVGPTSLLDPYHISFHIPLHRFFAATIRHMMFELNRSDEEIYNIISSSQDKFGQEFAYEMASGGSRILTTDCLFKMLLLHPLQVQTICYETKSNMWIRNGLTTAHQALAYVHHLFSYSTIDLDMFLLKYCASKLEPNYFINILMSRFHAWKWLSFKSNNLMSNASDVIRRPYHFNISPEQIVQMVENSLLLLIQLLTLNIHCDISQKEQTRQEMVAILSVKDRFYSNLCELLPEHSSHKPDNLNHYFSSLMDELTVFKPAQHESSGNLQQGCFTLKPNIWLNEYNPIQVLYRFSQKREYQQSMERFSQLCKREGCYRNSSLSGGGLWPPLRVPKEIGKFGQLDLSPLLECSSLAGVVFSIIYKHLYIGDVPDAIMAYAIHLLELALRKSLQRKDYKSCRWQTSAMFTGKYCYSELTSCPAYFGSKGEAYIKGSTIFTSATANNNNKDRLFPVVKDALDLAFETSWFPFQSIVDNCLAHIEDVHSMPGHEFAILLNSNNSPDDVELEMMAEEEDEDDNNDNNNNVDLETESTTTTIESAGGGRGEEGEMDYGDEQDIEIVYERHNPTFRPTHGEPTIVLSPFDLVATDEENDQPEEGEDVYDEDEDDAEDDEDDEDDDDQDDDDDDDDDLEGAPRFLMEHPSIIRVLGELREQGHSIAPAIIWSYVQEAFFQAHVDHLQLQDSLASITRNERQLVEGARAGSSSGVERGGGRGGRGGASRTNWQRLADIDRLYESIEQRHLAAGDPNLTQDIIEGSIGIAVNRIRSLFTVEEIRPGTMGGELATAGGSSDNNNRPAASRVVVDDDGDDDDDVVVVVDSQRQRQQQMDATPMITEEIASSSSSAASRLENNNNDAAVREADVEMVTVTFDRNEQTNVTLTTLSSSSSSPSSSSSSSSTSSSSSSSSSSSCSSSYASANNLTSSPGPSDEAGTSAAAAAAAATSQVTRGDHTYSAATQEGGGETATSTSLVPLHHPAAPPPAQLYHRPAERLTTSTERRAILASDPRPMIAGSPQRLALEASPPPPPPPPPAPVINSPVGLSTTTPTTTTTSTLQPAAEAATAATTTTLAPVRVRFNVRGGSSAEAAPSAERRQEQSLTETDIQARFMGFFQGGQSSSGGCSGGGERPRLRQTARRGGHRGATGGPATAPYEAIYNRAVGQEAARRARDLALATDAAAGGDRRSRWAELQLFQSRQTEARSVNNNNSTNNANRTTTAADNNNTNQTVGLFTQDEMGYLMDQLRPMATRERREFMRLVRRTPSFHPVVRPPHPPGAQTRPMEVLEWPAPTNQQQQPPHQHHHQEQQQQQQRKQQQRSKRAARRDKMHHGESILSLLLRLHAKYSHKARSYEFEPTRLMANREAPGGGNRIGDGAHFVTIVLDLICSLDQEPPSSLQPLVGTMAQKLVQLQALIWGAAGDDKAAASGGAGVDGGADWGADSGASGAAQVALGGGHDDVAATMPPREIKTNSAEPAPSGAHKAPPPPPAPSAPEASELDPAQRRRRARELQSRLMAQFASRQRAFIEKYDGARGGSFKGGAAADKAPSGEPINLSSSSSNSWRAAPNCQDDGKANDYDKGDSRQPPREPEQARWSRREQEKEPLKECCICAGGSANSTADCDGGERDEDTTNPLGLVVLLQATSVLGHAHLRAPDERRLPLSEEEQVRGCEETYARHLERRIDLLSEHFAESSWLDSINIGVEGGVHVQSCGHYLHIECHKSYIKSLDHDRPRFRQGHDEFQCPVCRQLSNSCLPIHTAASHWPQNNHLLNPIDPLSALSKKPATFSSQLQLIGHHLDQWRRQCGSPASRPSRAQLRSSALFCAHLTKATGAQYRLLRGAKASMHSLFLFLASIARTNLELEASSLVAGHHQASHHHQASFLPLFQVLALNARTLINERWFQCDQLWHQLTHELDEQARQALLSDGPKQRQVPLLLRDPMAMLLQFLFVLAPDLHLEQFQALVQVLFNLLVVQSSALVLTYGHLGDPADLDSRLWADEVKEEDDFDPESEVGDIMASVWDFLKPMLIDGNKVPLLNAVVRQSARHLRAAASAHQEMEEAQEEEEEGGSGKKKKEGDRKSRKRPQRQEQQGRRRPHRVTLAARVKLACLPFLRVAALIKQHLYSVDDSLKPKILPSACSLSSEAELQFSHLAQYLELGASSHSRKTLRSSLLWPACGERELIASWARELCHFHSDYPIGARSLLASRSLLWHPPSLLRLPSGFHEILLHYWSLACHLCQRVPRDLVICLQCGAPLCFRHQCCRDKTRHALYHSQQCGAQTCLFLSMNTSSIVVVRGQRACIWGFIYLDEHGEEDNGLVRGRPLYLVPERYKLLERQWLTHTFDHKFGKPWIWLPDHHHAHHQHPHAHPHHHHAHHHHPHHHHHHHHHRLHHH